MIKRQRREKERAQRIADLDRVDVDVTKTLSNLEAVVRKYDLVQEEFLRLIGPIGH